MRHLTSLSRILPSRLDEVRLNRVKPMTRQGSVSLFTAIGLVSFSTSALAEPWIDPAPPTPNPVDESKSKPPVASPHERVTFHAPPRDLSSKAVTASWPRFLGPADDATSPETHLLSKFPEGGPAKVWEMEKGSGYTSPVIAEGRLFFFDRLGDDEILECLDPETGNRLWKQSYPIIYTDRYGFNNGPRASAVLSGDRVITLGVTSVLSCYESQTGQLLWRRKLMKEFDLASSFFGHGSCPLVYEGKVIVPLGTDDQLSVAAFDLATGKLVWGTRHEWNASYASPVIAELQGKPRLLVFQGGESDPATGGLLCIDPADGTLHDAFFWRPDKYESVNSSTPIAVGNDEIFLSSSYQYGGVLLHLNQELKWEERWRAPEFGLHWMTPVAFNGHLYGFRGRNEPDAWLASYDIATGEENWREDLEWTVPLKSGRDYRMKYLRGSLLRADGRFYALGELGSLGILQLAPDGVESLDRAQLFLARSTWSLPVLHRGLLYVSQHEDDQSGNPPRLICYDLRAE